MEKSSLRSFVTVFAGKNGRTKYWKITFLVFLFCCLASVGWGAVSITPATGGANICSNKAVGGSAAGFTTLGPISITENINSDFSGGASVVDVIVLNAPTGWQFSSTLPTFSYITGSNITSVTGSITGSTLTINISVNNITNADQLMITGLQVQATSAGASSGNIYASYVSGVAGLTTGTSGSNFGNLSLLAPATPSVSIAGSPSGSICPGTSVTFTPTAVNGGSAPIFHWLLNGTNVAIGGAYANNSLTTGNTISCTLTSSNTCVTANPVMSNTITMTVITAPAAITGTTTICPGMTASLSDPTSGGTWSSSNTSVATITSGGVVSGIATGTSRISYIAGGCPATTTMYINAPPLAPALTPTATAICSGSSVTIATSGTAAPGTILSQNFNGGLAPWTVDNTGSVGTLSGAEWKSCGDGYVNEQGLYHSPDNSSFVMSNSDTSGSSSYTASKLISPLFSLYGYSSATLSFQHSYDYWPSGDINVNLEISTNGGGSWSTIVNYTGATIGAKNSFVSQTYSLNAYLGYTDVMIRFNYYCHWGYFWAIDNILIIGTPSLVTPTWSPTTYLFSDAAFSTPYTSGTPANTVYVHPTTVTSPTTVTYTATAVQGGCTSTSASVVSVNPAPGSTTGNLNICVGTSSTLTNGGAGGTWVSSNTSIATIGSSTGTVTGVATGTVAVSYISGTSCVVVSVVTVNSTPAAIAGSPHLCLGYTSTLTDATTGGTWASSNSSIASIASTTGIVTASALGTANITYSLGAGCTATATVTVHTLPSSVTGTAIVCAGQTTTLGDVTSGGSWSSGATGIATVGTGSGIVTGVAGGTVNITYTVITTGCFAFKPVTVNPMGPITGNTNLCLGLTSALGNVATGGTWASSNTSIATIDAATGVATGVATGNVIITYLISATGCVAYTIATVFPLPADITGTQVVCMGATTSLADATTGGIWSSSSPSIATVTGTGTVNGLLAGTTLISYTASSGCPKTATVTVNPIPAAIIGAGIVCVGSTTSLNNATSGGDWSSGNTAYATVGSTGIVSGVAAGTVYITYTLPTGCFVARLITVNPLPAGIAGTANVCQGLTAALTDATTGGTWLSSNSSIAVINSSGVVTGAIAGTATITYTVATGCIATYVITVNALPLSIIGPSTVCTGTSIALTDATSGGSWTSSNPSYATVDASGIVSGVSVGTVNVTYSVSTGCIRTANIIVNSSPAIITGNTSSCVGFTSILSDATIFGSWSSSNGSVATISPTSGSLTGIAPGTAIVTYSLATGCMDTALITVYSLPAAITGGNSLCLGQVSTLSNSSFGGTWSSSITTVASIGSGTGIVTGAGLGTAIVTYTLLTGCTATTMVTVNPLPSPISGASSVCVGSTTNYTTLSSGGIWSSSNESIASVTSTTGIVSGIAAGTAIITYMLPTGCTAVKTIIVNPIPAPIVGPGNVCQSATANFTNTTTGGTWSSSTVSVATIGSLTGIMNGVAGGIMVVTYSLSTGCLSATAVTVTALPATISGANNVCVGSSMILLDATTGGSWLSSTPSIATIGVTTGVINGIAAGTTIVTYALPVGCVATTIITVNPLPAPITGNTSLCFSQPSTLADATSGGTWNSSNPSFANITPTTGIVTGYILGTATITYTLVTGCITTTIVTVNVLPSVIAGPASVCIGYSAALSNSISGGNWSSSNATLATVGTASGIVSGISYGSLTITYALSTGCAATKNMTVNTLPEPITGTPVVCQGLSTIMSSATTGGSWSSGSLAVATVLPTTGSVTGTAAGTALISYTLGTGCFVTTTVTVYALPSVIGGNANVCLGFTSTLATTTPGGAWSSGNVAVATIDPVTAVVSGITLGTSIITYAIGTGCSVYKTVTVNSLPDAISGTFSTCPGIPVSLTNTTTGGSWSSGTPSIGTINSGTGVVTALSAGTVIMSYTTGTGCFSTAVFTVNAVSPVIGSNNMCVGAITSLSNAVSGGTWTSSNTAVVNVGLTSGIAVGYTVSTANITYRQPGGCLAIFPVTVNALPSPITGSGSVCPGFTITLNSLTPGGSWSSSNPLYASVGSGSGIVTGIIAGTVPSYLNIVYSMPSGCSASKVITVNPLPAAITGTASICIGMSSVFTSAAPGGTWSSSTPSVASAGLTSGLVSGLSVGTAGITYTPSSGCIATAVVTVNGLPSTISGVTNLCTGSSSTLSDATSGGTWSSTNASVASVTSAGVVNGLVPGTSIISYTAGIGCAVTAVVSVNIMPVAITGIPSVCQGYTTTFSSGPLGGSWVSGNTSTATVGATGLVSGVTPGTATISYLFSSGCNVTQVVTVSAPPSVVAGATNTCVGLTTTLSDPAAGGGTWSSNNTAVATIGSATGVATGIAAGVATITYTIGTGCTTVTAFTVNPLPLPIGGIMNACVGMNTSLSDGSSGGAWSSGNTAVASVSIAGLVGGLSTGTSVITYMLPTGCIAASMITVNPLPGPVTGPSTVCQASSVTLGNIVTGGSWSSGNPAIGTVNTTTGVVTGILGGTTEISYVLGAGCSATSVVSVYPLPASISGVSSVCQGLTIHLTNSTGGGTWSSSNTSVATVDVGSGIVTGNNPGTAAVSYTIGTGCSISKEITVNPLAPVTGTATLCAGFTTALFNSGSGGAWSSGDISVATVNPASGIVTGVTPGTAPITYSLSTGCKAITTVTVIPVSPITGVGTVCAGQATALSNSSAGGIWNSGNAFIAAVDITTGIVAGVASGTATISYTFGTGCVATTVVTVNPLSIITGSNTVCAGLTTPLNNATPGGTWTSGNTAVATVGAGSGLVSGIAAGTANITYLLPTGCRATRTITVNPLSSITGVATVCSGSSISLANATSGGTWSSSNTTVATVAPTTGLVSGSNAGTATIAYTLGTGCANSVIVTVNPLPSAITGVTNVCTGSNSSLGDVSTGGTWTSANTSIVTVGSGSGVITGVAPGASLITYTLPTGCFVAAAIAVNPLPAPIAGALHVCEGLFANLSDADAGGTWASTNSSVATIASATGIVTGIAAGNSTIIYTLTTGCTRPAVLTVDPLPSAIAGTPIVCVGQTTNLSDVAPSGSWSSSNISIASVGSATGVVAGMSAGTSKITYMLPTGCIKVITVTVNPVPGAITGNLNVCNGLTSGLASTPSGGVWISGATSIATIDGSSGLVSGIAAGTSQITYSLFTGCFTTAIATVNPLPAPVVAGAANVCAGLSLTVTDATSGGTWMSSSPGTGSVSASGVVTGISAGVTIISYVLPTSCFTATPVTVNPLPSAITGVPVVCENATTVLANTVSGGSWTSGDPGKATVDAASGIVTGISSGTTTITYTLSTGCMKWVIVTVNHSPAAISGTPKVCTGFSTTLTDATLAGVWSATGAAGIAAVSSSGVVNGFVAGVVTISYTLATGCAATVSFTVNSLPPAIAIPGNICSGATATFTDAVTGGTWASSNPAVATVGMFSGIVAGVGSGTSIITYTLPTGCSTISVINVDPLPLSIVGTTHLCAGTNITLTDATIGGVWSSSNPGVAGVGAGTGVVSGMAVGTSVIAYTLPSGCNVTALVAVDALPAPIGGGINACLGLTTIFTNTVSGGTWSSSNTTVATITAGGVASGLSLGTTNIIYTLSTGCSRSLAVAVSPVPSPISGTSAICEGLYTSLSDPSAGGTWSSAAPLVANVDFSSGFVTAIAPGTSVIHYSFPTGCSASMMVTVNPLLPIAGSANGCIADTIHMNNLVPGGTWSSSTVGVATVSSSGVVSCSASGIVIISYTLGTGCIATHSITVNPAPVAFFVTGGGSFCSGSPGIPVGLNSSVVGFTYHLYNGAAPVSSVTGSGAALNFGPQEGGVYTVMALNPATGCTRVMIGSAVVTEVAYGPAAVSITTPSGDTVCAAATTLFTAVPYLGGSSPAFRWYVNGAIAGTSPSLSYIPSNGDVVECKLTSSASCAVPDTAASARTITVVPNVSPLLTIAAAPGDTVCQFMPVSFTTTPVYGGLYPQYTWVKNGFIVDTGATYAYAPANGDDIYCVLTSNERCTITDTASSNLVLMSVAPYVVPSVVVTADPGFDVTPGQHVTFTATVTNGGTSPSFQWTINSIAVPGANSPVFVTSTLADKDSVACNVLSSGICSGIASSGYGIIRMQNLGASQVSKNDNGMIIMPNPNNGAFTVKGFLSGPGDQLVGLQVTDLLGQVVYESTVKAAKGVVNSRIILDRAVASGIYLLTLHCKNGNKVFHFVVRQ